MAAEQPQRWYREYPVASAILLVYVALFFGMCLGQRVYGGRWPGLWRLDVAPSALVAFGALESDAVLHRREYWRLLTATLLHGNLAHLFLNGFALWQLGRAIEVWFGGRLLLVLHVLLGVLANVVSVWMHRQAGPMVQVGASGALFGFVGFIALVGWYGRRREGYRLLRIMLFWMGLSLGFGAWIGADNAAHIGGAAAGVLAGVFAPWLQRRPGARWLLTVGCGAALGFAATAAGLQVVATRTALGEARRRAVRLRDADQFRLLLIADRQLRGLFVLTASKPEVLDPLETRTRLAGDLEQLARRVDNAVVRQFLDECRGILAPEGEAEKPAEARRQELLALGRRYGAFLQNGKPAEAEQP